MRWAALVAALAVTGCASVPAAPPDLLTVAVLNSPTNYAVSQPDLTGIALSPIADVTFL